MACHGSVDPIATLSLPKGVHDNTNINTNTNNKNVGLQYFSFSHPCATMPRKLENAGYPNDGFMTTADAFFPFVNQKF